MSFPDDALTDEEDLVLHLRPHAKAAVRPVLVLTVALAAVLTAWVMLPRNDGGTIGVAVVGAFALYAALRHGVWPLLVWRCTHYVLTGERVLLQRGVLSRDRRDLPLHRIDQHTLRQSPLGRLLGYGTLRIDAVGEEPAVLAAVPRPARVQTTLYELVEHAPEPPEEDEAEVAPQRTRGRR